MKVISFVQLLVIFTLTLLTYTMGAPQTNPDKDAQILRYESENIGVDGFKWAFETSNGIAADEQGQLTNVGTENESISVKGSFKYVGPDGVTYTVTYVADEGGFQPQGDHIPKTA